MAFRPVNVGGGVGLADWLVGFECSSHGIPPIMSMKLSSVAPARFSRHDRVTARKRFRPPLILMTKSATPSPSDCTENGTITFSCTRPAATSPLDGIPTLGTAYD